MEVAPFEKLRARSLLWWMPLCGLLLFPIFYLPGAEVGNSLVTSAWFLSSLLGWVLWKTWRCGINLGYLLGPIPTSCRTWRLAVMAVPMFLFAAGATWLIYYPLSFAFPSYVESFLSRATFQFSDHGLLYNAGRSIFAIVFFPIVEELAFRGVLLNRWTHKWGIVPAIFASSLAFGLGHPHRLIAFMIGIVLAVLYIRSGSLMISVAAHMGTNALAVCITVLTASLESISSATGSLEAFRSNYWVGLICLGLSVPALGHFFYKSWPLSRWREPYEQNAGRSTREGEQSPEPSEVSQVES